MPWLHVPEPLLRRFVDGELSEPEAVAVALHLDDCPACAGRALAAEPLAAAFASVADPVVPPQLLPDVQARLARDQAGPPASVPALVAGLSAAAVLVFVVLGAPGQLLAGISALLSAAGALLRAVEVPMSVVAPVWLAAAMLTFAAAAVTARRLELGSIP